MGAERHSQTFEPDGFLPGELHYVDGLRGACAALGHRHLHGDEVCVCGQREAFAPSGMEVALVQDRYLEVGADALCKARGHESPPEMRGLSGFSWRDGTCSCDEDARVVLAAAGRVAPHVECREALDAVERVNTHLRDLIKRRDLPSGNEVLPEYDDGCEGCDGVGAVSTGECPDGLECDWPCPACDADCPECSGTGYQPLSDGEVG